MTYTYKCRHTHTCTRSIHMYLMYVLFSFEFVLLIIKSICCVCCMHCICRKGYLCTLCKCHEQIMLNFLMFFRTNQHKYIQTHQAHIHIYTHKSLHIFYSCIHTYTYIQIYTYIHIYNMLGNCNINCCVQLFFNQLSLHSIIINYIHTCKQYKCVNE